MKLNELLEKITPLPWREVSAADGDKWVGTDQGDDRIATLDGNTTSIDHAYLVHAANVLQELLAAAENLQDNWEHNLTQPITRLREAIKIAEDVPAVGHSAPRPLK